MLTISFGLVCASWCVWISLLCRLRHSDPIYLFFGLMFLQHIHLLSVSPCSQGKCLAAKLRLTRLCFYFCLFCFHLSIGTWQNKLCIATGNLKSCNLWIIWNSQVTPKGFMKAGTGSLTLVLEQSRRGVTNLLSRQLCPAGWHLAVEQLSLHAADLLNATAPLTMAFSTHLAGVSWRSLFTRFSLTPTIGETLLAAESMQMRCFAMNLLIVSSMTECFVHIALILHWPPAGFVFLCIPNFIFFLKPLLVRSKWIQRRWC